MAIAAVMPITRHLWEAASSGTITNHTKERKDHERKQQSPEPPDRTRVDRGGSRPRHWQHQYFDDLLLESLYFNQRL
jgi:hypothetical protein